MTDDELILVPAAPEVHTVADAARIKASTVGATDAHWRADLWANAEAAIAFANSPPLAGPGAIVFNQRENGQVWTFYLTGSQVWSSRGIIIGQDFEGTSKYMMASQ